MAYEPKTRPTDASVDAYLADIADPARRRDCEAVRALMEEVTGCPPQMWGPGIVGFGRYALPQGNSGKSFDWPLTGFASRKTDLTLYIMPGFDDYAALMAQLGKHRNGKSCLYLKRLSDIDLAVLRELVRESVRRVRERYPD